MIVMNLSSKYHPSIEDSYEYIKMVLELVWHSGEIRWNKGCGCVFVCLCLSACLLSVCLYVYAL